MGRAHTSDFDRGRVVGYKDMGLNYQEIEERTGVRRSSAQRVHEDWRLDNKSTYKRPPGRNHIFPQDKQRQILGELSQNRHISFPEVGEKEGCSASTIRRIAAKDGLRRYVEQESPGLNEKVAYKRLEWARRHRDLEWKRVIWTDEVPLTENKDPRRRYITRRQGEAHKHGFVKPPNPQGMDFMAWACVSYNYKSPLYRHHPDAPTPELRYKVKRPPRKTAANGVNGVKYAEFVLRGPIYNAWQTLSDEGRAPLLLEDNAPSHNNEYCDKTRAELGLVRLEHTPSSPDLNIIEHVWSALNDDIWEDKTPCRNKEKYWQKCLRAWDKVEQSYINKLIEGMPRRLEVVEEAQGWETRY